MKIAEMSVELVDSMGTDLSVVRAARVSFAKDASNYTEAQNEKLIKYLAANNHWTPFGHCFATFRLKVPMAIAMQLDKHTVGLVSNSVSRRYVSETPEVWKPVCWRKKAANVKQGSSEEEFQGYVFHEYGKNEKFAYGVDTSPDQAFDFVVETAIETYEAFIEAGICAEQARFILPMCTMMERVWSGSLAAWARVCNLRLDPHAQKECKDVAELIANNCKTLWPISWKSLIND